MGRQQLVSMRLHTNNKNPLSTFQSKYLPIQHIGPC
uniref:Uncharacterized protein n=1 Tax=Rhizophora mucronata TaxID=61149 RepID=A0A2P2Q059_RHIMU